MSEDSLFAINLPEGERPMDPDGKKVRTVWRSEGKRYCVEVPCTMNRYCAELLRSLEDENASSRYPPQSRNLNSGIPVPGKCPEAGERSVSLFLVQALAVVHKIFECGSREWLSS